MEGVICAPSTSRGHDGERAFHLLLDALNVPLPTPHSGRAELAAAMENDDARADEFCAPTENSTGFEIFDNSRKTKSIVRRVSNPMMLFRDMTEVNSTMVIGHGVITFRIGALADEFKCFARSKVYIGITAAINSGG